MLGLRGWPTGPGKPLRNRWNHIRAAPAPGLAPPLKLSVVVKARCAEQAITAAGLPAVLNSSRMASRLQVVSSGTSRPQTTATTGGSKDERTPMPTDLSHIRNFCIVAHIDHGKSTLADRILLRCGAITEREFHNQMLDDMDLERERGITIKASNVTMNYTAANGERYQLNLIDTPGHVDFHYEVQKALQACEGALLLVDATQGVQAQTVANAYLAIDAGLEIIPVINKCDLPSARPEDCADELEQVLGMPAEQALFVSAKTGLGIDELLESVITKLPPPGKEEAIRSRPAKALVVDSKYDDFKGVLSYIRVVEGTIKVGQKLKFMRAQREHGLAEAGKLTPRPAPVDVLYAGEVGWLACNIKSLADVNIGETVTVASNPASEPLPGYRPPQHMVYCDFYPTANTQFHQLRDAFEKLILNDNSFTYTPESSDALGFGFRCGFLGLLHMDVIQERLEREYQVEVIQTAPNVTYEILKTDGSIVRIDSPSKLPEPNYMEEIREPIVKCNIIVPEDCIGAIMTLAQDRRGTYKKTDYLSRGRVILVYELPLAEIIYDFYDKLKTVTRGYGTMDYELTGFKAENLVKMDILVNGDAVAALSSIVHRSVAEHRGRRLIRRLRKQIARHQFEIPLQAAIGTKVIARETIKAVRKDVLAKCYGGDVSRKRKLLEKQKEGKKRMKQIGSVEIPQEAFMSVLVAGNDDDDDDLD